MSENDRVTLYGVGDVGPIGEDPPAILDLVRDRLKKEADIRFCQVETLYSERGALQAHLAGAENRLHPRHIDDIIDAGFTVGSLAGNHALDWGPEALLDTVELFRRKGIQSVGAGKDINEARQPVFVDKKGVKIAFLAYCSILRDGYWATAGKPGCVPMRASTYYEPLEYQPGTPVKIVTTPNQEDLEALKEDIRKAKAQADVVVMSIHWGIHFEPKTIAMYQPVVGHAAIDAGADLILGHHAHILKGIEVYKGKVIFYSLCNFAMNFKVEIMKKNRVWQIYRWEPDPGCPDYGFPADSRKTIIAKGLISKSGIERVSFLPVMINKKAQPEILSRSEPRFAEVVKYLEWCSEDFGTKFRVEGDEAVVVG